MPETLELLTGHPLEGDGRITNMFRAVGAHDFVGAHAIFGASHTAHQGSSGILACPERRPWHVHDQARPPRGARPRAGH